MKKYEKEVQQAYLDNEKAVLKNLEGNYKDALAEINNKIEILLARQDADMQHVIYQVQYQESLKKQVEAILETLHSNEFETVSEYLTKSYEEGFLGAMYSLQSQGVPLVFPLDQEQVVAAIQHETKLSEDLYKSLGKDIKVLSKQIAGEISRGIANAAMYSEIARNIANCGRIPQNNAMRIARTESHRIQCKATMDACNKAKEKGADVVKQWDSTLDGKTRDTHRQLDGQIRELDEPFEVEGKKAMYPGGFGDPAEDCNCRCALLQRARWAIGNDYTKWSADASVKISDDGTTQLVKIEAKNYEDFQKKYKQAVENVGKNSKIVFKEAKTIDEAKQYAKETLGFSTADYDKFNIDIANMVNKEVTNIYNVFGNIHDAGWLEGVRLYPKKTDWYAAYSPGWKEIFFKNVSSKTAIKKMVNDAKNSFKLGFWSTDNAEHAIRHETGHAVQHWLTDNNADKLKKITELRNNVMKSCGITTWDINDTPEHMKAAGDVISYYALRNEGEFIAESVAEYMAGNPRNIAKQVVEILLEGK